ncbi:MAG: methyltransferase domain-containing protein [Desulfomonile tiedjei]|nr:methyltransferase domain-containing protein [Desulfomonile tiedjei]
MSHHHHEVERALERLSALTRELGDRVPSILIVVSAYQGVARLEATLAQIHPDLFPLIREITIFDVFSELQAEGAFLDLRHTQAWEKLRYVRIPRPYHYGENLKNCFDYAISKEFDYVVILRGDGTYDPAYLPLFLEAALVDECDAVIGDRMEHPGSVRLAANRLLSLAEELILGMGLRDYHCGYRLIATQVLRKIPYGLNVSDYLFDLHLLIQIRCLGIRIGTVPVPEFHDKDVSTGQMIAYATRAVRIAIGYRLHQLHILRRATYFVDLGENYTLKRNRYSSHMQILDSLKPGSMVLDVGCGQSLLAEEYARRGITVVGLDSIPAEKVSPFVHRYLRHDLETPPDLPYGREFDYIILSDVIEHIANRDALMNSLRRHLKLDGRLIASTGNIAIWFYRLSLLLGRFEYGPRGILDRTHVHLFTLDSFTRFFRQKGYRLLEVRYTPIPFELVFSSTGRSSLVEGITRWYHRLTMLWPRMFAYQFIVSCTFRSYESALGEETWKPLEEMDSSGKSREDLPEASRGSVRGDTTPRGGER